MMDSPTARRREPALRDRVEVRAHPTVVRLDDLEGEHPDWLTEAYHITGEVENHLSALRQVLDRPTGCGLFLIGQYGSGKSHFLAYVTRRLRGGEWLADPPAVVPLSLLNYRAELALEDIVEAALGLEGEADDRRHRWSRLAERFPGGLLLLLDELSEFLRSKPDPARFAEDVRFLQFMAEWAQGERLWILAAMQEQIEHTGTLEHGTYRKIKDRFPIRFMLTPAHVKDLLSESILVKKEGYDQGVRELAAELRQAFPRAAAMTAALADIYPVHPATLELLEEVRDRFSQARGVVDFTVTRLAGDPARGVPAFLDRPWGSLLTPDAIVDHFRDLFELQPEFQPLAQQLLPYYRKHMTEIFESPRLQEIAGRLVKLLVLTHLSPAREGLDPEEAASWLLFRATRIDPQKNLLVVERTLTTLVERGRFVTRRGRRFALDLADEGGEALERYLEREKAELRDRGDVLFEVLAPLLAREPFNPFELPRDRWQRRNVRWYFHERPLAFHLGNETPPAAKDPTRICVRLPWGDAATIPEAHTVTPARLTVTEEVTELAALTRARERTWSPETSRRLEARFAERLEFFAARVRGAYLDATVTTPGGNVERLSRLDRIRTFGDWLDGVAQCVLRRAFPAFERFAPSHGPLPKEAYRAFMRFAREHDLGDEEADDAVKIVREAYLVPMHLLERRGRDYRLPRDPEKIELVKLVQPTLELEVTPRVVYEHLAASVYGLVPDQVSVLLVYLLVLGEIDILKDNKSYRELYETLPNPIQYDRIVPGSALRLEQIQELEALVAGLGLRRPKQWTVLGQRRGFEQLRDRGRRERERLQALVLRLQSAGEGAKLVERLRGVIARWSALEKGSRGLEGLKQFLYEIGSARAFLETVAELEGLPERVDRLLDALGRYRHLLGHPALAEWSDPELQARLATLAEPPGLEQPAALEVWLGRAREAYDRYRGAYAKRHDEWWHGVSSHPIWTWQPPSLSRSTHVGVQAEVKGVLEAKARAFEMRCHGLGNLDFQPVCRCGFDGTAAAVEKHLRAFERLRREIEEGVERFFGRQEVRQRIRRWVDEGLEVSPGTLAYLEGGRPLPEIENVALLDRHLAGLDLVREVDGGALLGLLEGRAWEPSALRQAFHDFVERQGAARLRITAGARGGSPALARWCLEQALRTGAELPRELAARDLEAAGAEMTPEWIGPGAGVRLERMRLPEPVLDRILGWIVEGRVAAPAGPVASAPVAAAREAAQPRDPETALELAELSARLYSAHPRLVRSSREAWLARLDRLARTVPPRRPEPLMNLLEANRASQWLVVDALGLPLLPAFRERLGELLPSWRLESVEFGMVPDATTTDAFFGEMARAGIQVPLRKINCVDVLLHARAPAFPDLTALAMAELAAAFRPLREQLDPGRPLLVFADHGFRLSPDGNTYVHGGRSALEAIVPVVRLGAI